MRQLATAEPSVASISGLSQVEIGVLAVLAGSLLSPDDSYSLWSLQRDAEKAGITKLGTTLGIRRLFGQRLRCKNDRIE